VPDAQCGKKRKRQLWDGIDNDGDGTADCGVSTILSSVRFTSLHSDLGCGCNGRENNFYYCGDGVDNDNDGYVDGYDSNCRDLLNQGGTTAPTGGGGEGTFDPFAVEGCAWFEYEDADAVGNEMCCETVWDEALQRNFSDCRPKPGGWVKLR